MPWVIQAAIGWVRQVGRRRSVAPAIGRDGAEQVAHLAGDRVRHDAAVAEADGEHARLVDAVVGVHPGERGAHERDVLPVGVGPTRVGGIGGGAEPLAGDEDRVGHARLEVVVVAARDLHRGAGAPVPREHQLVRLAGVVVRRQRHDVRPARARRRRSCRSSPRSWRASSRSPRWASPRRRCRCHPCRARGAAGSGRACRAAASARGAAARAPAGAARAAGAAGAAAAAMPARAGLCPRRCRAPVPRWPPPATGSRARPAGSSPPQDRSRHDNVPSAVPMLDRSPRPTPAASRPHHRRAAVDRVVMAASSGNGCACYRTPGQRTHFTHAAVK